MTAQRPGGVGRVGGADRGAARRGRPGARARGRNQQLPLGEHRAEQRSDGTREDVLRRTVSKNDELRIQNEKLCIKNKESCIKSEECCIQNDEFCSSTKPTLPNFGGVRGPDRFLYGMICDAQRRLDEVLLTPEGSCEELRRCDFNRRILISYSRILISSLGILIFC